MIPIKIKRIDQSLPLPQYKTKGAVAVDLYVRKTVTIKPREIQYIPLNVIVEVPDHCWVLIAPRSSTHKLGIMQANSIGIGDRDFCGANDEYHFAAFNFTDQNIVVERGMRIAQMMILQFQPVVFEEVESLEKESRGGFGSTGLH
ncbi:dUTP diphosphatase [Candidatus Woesearchaeota archaeon]|nr:dUTP diphosphatase [Candidatus Woesearchaeota archaeon]